MAQPNREHFTLNGLNPAMIPAVEKLITATNAFWFEVGGEHGRFEPFEGYRSPVRQHYLLTVDKTTKAGPWQSAHQYGLAVDFAIAVYDIDKARFERWSWQAHAPWRKLKSMARAVKLDIPIAWDLGHVEHPLFADIRKLL